jgi:16S rRNA processing protein RimM
LIFLWAGFSMSIAETVSLEDLIEVGKIVSAHGIRGEMRVYPNTDFPERFEKKGVRWLLRPGQAHAEEVRLTKGYFQDGKGLYVIQLQAVTDRNAAEALRGCTILVRKDDRPDLDEGEFHVSDLVGLSVYMQESQALVGEVVNVLFAGNDLLEVAIEGRKEPALIPFVEAIVPIVDLAKQRIEITPPPGLI